MCRIEFRSLEDPNDTCYTWNKEAYGLPWFCVDEARQFAYRAGQYRTYGDGTCQHSGEHLVSREQFLDYLASLASHLISHSDDTVMECLASRWPRVEVRRDVAVFAFKLRFNPEKRRWYSMEECRVSAASSKQYDKRWQQIPEYADGSFEASIRLLGAWDSLSLQRYAAATAIKEWWYEETEEVVTNREIAKIADLIPSDPGREHTTYANNVQVAFYIVDRYVQAYRLVDDARRNWSALEHNYVARQLEAVA